MKWLCASALCAGCLHVDDISLGALEQDAGSMREAPDAVVLAPIPPQVTTPDAGHRGDPREETEHEEEEPPALTRDAGSQAVAAMDAGPAARPSDGSLDGAAEAGGIDAGGDAALDSGPLDASIDAQRSLLCTLEPWHCL